MAIGLMVGRSFFWNLSAAVGTGQPNHLDDVELVRFGYVMLRSASDAGVLPASLRSIAAAMRKTGGFDKDLDAVIRAHQEFKHIPQDGKVSVANATLANHGKYDRKHPWIMVNLNNFMHDFNLFPRIDLHPDIGPEIRKVVHAAMFNE